MAVRCFFTYCGGGGGATAVSAIHDGSHAAAWRRTMPLPVTVGLTGTKVAVELAPSLFRHFCAVLLME